MNLNNCDILVTQSAPSSPTFKKPLTQQPSTQQQSIKKPTTLQPPAQKPSAQQPSTQKPHTQQPSTLEPASLKPSTRKQSTIQFTMKPATKFLSLVSQAVGDVVGMGTPAPVTDNSTNTINTTTEPDPSNYITPEGSAIGAEDQETPLSKAGDWNSTFEEQVLMDESNPNLQMVLIGNEYFAIN